jgi:hypothetical protein
MFFDDHPRFLDTSSTANQLSRLNWRHRAMIEDNVDLLRGKRVIDIASHDGRWSYAALRAGASHVTGIEARPQLVRNAEMTLEHYGASPNSYRFIVGDVFQVLREADESKLRADVAMCLGFLYHTIRYPELLLGIRATGVEHLVLDTAVASGPQRVVRLFAENVESESNAAPGNDTFGGKALVGWPTPSALEFILDSFGFDVVKRFDWQSALVAGKKQAVGQYRRGRRVTWVAKARPALGD